MKTYFVTSLLVAFMALSTIYLVRGNDAESKNIIEDRRESAQKTSHSEHLNSLDSDADQEKLYALKEKKSKVKAYQKYTHTASELDVVSVQVFNSKVDYLKQPSLNNLLFVYNDLSSAEIMTLISKIEKLLEIKKYVQRYNQGGLSVQESMFFASLTHRLSAARLVKIQRKIDQLGDVENEGT